MFDIKTILNALKLKFKRLMRLSKEPGKYINRELDNNRNK